MIYHTMGTRHRQFCKTRPYTQIQSQNTEHQNKPQHINFVLLSVNNLALQLMKLVRTLYILQTIHVVSDSFIQNSSAPARPSAVVPGGHGLSMKHCQYR